MTNRPKYVVGFRGKKNTRLWIEREEPRRDRDYYIFGRGARCANFEIKRGVLADVHLKDSYFSYGPQTQVARIIPDEMISEIEALEAEIEHHRQRIQNLLGVLDQALDDAVIRGKKVRL